MFFIIACPDGYIESGTICENCDSNCETCEIDKYTCLSCPEGSYLKNNECFTNCGTGYYP